MPSRRLVFQSISEKIESIIRERYGGILPRGALLVISEEVGVSRQYVWKVAVDFAQANRAKDDKRRRCEVEGCDGYARYKSQRCAEHINVYLVCTQCGARFARRKCVQDAREKKPSYAGTNFCNRLCHGRYIGQHYGYKKKERNLE